MKPRKAIFSVHEFVPRAFWSKLTGEETSEASPEHSKESFLSEVNRVIGKSQVPLDHTMVNVDYRENAEGKRERIFFILSEEHARQYYHGHSENDSQFTFADEVPNTAQYNMDDSLWTSVRDYVQEAQKSNATFPGDHEGIAKALATSVRSINAFDKDKPSVFFALLVRFMDLGLSEDRIRSLLAHESPYVQAAGVVIARYVFSPAQIDDILLTPRLVQKTDGETVNIIKGESISIPSLIEKMIENDEFLEAWFPIYPSVHHAILCENFRRVWNGRAKVYEDDSYSTLPFDFSSAASFFEYIHLPTGRSLNGRNASNPSYRPSGSSRGSSVGAENRSCSSNSLLDHGAATRRADFEDTPYM